MGTEILGVNSRGEQKTHMTWQIYIVLKGKVKEGREQVWKALISFRVQTQLLRSLLGKGGHKAIRRYINQ